jgi:DNA repair protein RecN (Recombination protein N)
MLQYLRIRNLALLEEVSLEFRPGFIAVTGETGAGKSVLLGALSLLSGARADKSLIRQGAQTCEVEGILHLSETAQIDAVLREMGLPSCEEGVLLLSRVLDRSKAPKVRINGQLATVGNLQTLGECWIDFHGPGEPQKLFHERWQLALIDLFARNSERLAAYEADYGQWRELLAERERLIDADQLSPDERDFLQTQIAAIDALELNDESLVQLEQDFTRMSNAQELVETATGLASMLEGEEGVTERLSAALVAARELGRVDASQKVLADRLESILLEVSDLAAEFGSTAEAASFEPEVAAALEEKMEQWLSLKRKYGGSLEAVSKRRAEMAERLASQGDIEGTLKRLEAEAAKLAQKLEKQAETLREHRLRAAHQLSKEAATLVNSLGFKKAKLQIEVVREANLREYGNSRVQFLFAPNPGQAPMPLNKIASSGEIARVMLALKAVLAKVDATPVLVFDEVDANVGGEIARVVGRELASLGKDGHQVFCITHLPQVASTAPSHWVVRKEQTDDSTAIRIESLTDEREMRLEELTRMLGDRSSASGRRHAEELLGSAE